MSEIENYNDINRRLVDAIMRHGDESSQAISLEDERCRAWCRMSEIAKIEWRRQNAPPPITGLR